MPVCIGFVGRVGDMHTVTVDKPQAEGSKGRGVVCGWLVHMVRLFLFYFEQACHSSHFILSFMLIKFISQNLMNGTLRKQCWKKLNILLILHKLLILNDNS